MTPSERAAALELVSRVRRRVPAELVQASLFGSKARGEARPDSDVDLLLVFRRLPFDREPHASLAEEIAEALAAESGSPVTVWSVSLADLLPGWRTPMLIDALEDSVPLWCAGAPLPALPFTPADALRCTSALLDRLDEGSDEFADLLLAGERQAALRRGRDDLVRMATAWLLLRGETRPRRAEVVRRFRLRLRRERPLPGPLAELLDWAEDSFGASGREEEGRISLPAGGEAGVAAAVTWLRGLVLREREALRTGLAAAEPTGARGI